MFPVPTGMNRGPIYNPRAFSRVPRAHGDEPIEREAQDLDGVVEHPCDKHDADGVDDKEDPGEQSFGRLKDGDREVEAKQVNEPAKGLFGLFDDLVIKFCFCFGGDDTKRSEQASKQICADSKPREYSQKRK